VPPRRELLLAGALIASAAIVGLWQSSRRAELAELDRADLALAGTAAAYLSVVVPTGGANGYDPARLLAGVNTLSRASFWPGGLQLALGAIPLLPDTIGLLPMPDSLLRLLDAGREGVIARHARARVGVVPFLDRDRWGILGWAATWGTVRHQLPSLAAALLTTVAGACLVVAALVFLREVDRRWRILAFLCALGFLAALAVDLGWSVHQAARVAAETRLLTLKRLIEVAATAPGVRQAMLPEIAVEVEVRPWRGTVTPATDVSWGRDQLGPFLSVVAATPRTQGGLELILHPGTSGLARLRLVLAGWVVLGAAGLGLIAWGARVRAKPPAQVPP
jgi:hypothetical protein